MEKPTRFMPQATQTNKQPALQTGTSRAEFDTAGLDKFVVDRGIQVLWEKSYLCPCRSRITRSPDPSCRRCHGKGVAYLPAVQISVAIQSQEKGPNSMDMGLYDSGTAIGTTQVEDGVTFRDRLTLPHVQVSQSLVFNIDQKRIDSGMFLTYDVKDITFATTLDRVLKEGSDFTVDKENNILYPAQELLDNNISINLDTTLRYIVIDLLKESRYQYTGKGTPVEQFDRLPKKLLLKREDAWVSPTPFTVDTGSIDPDVVDPKRNMHTTNLGGFFGGEI